MHKDFWNNQKEYPQQKSFHNKNSGFTKDPDAAVILPVIMLLLSDGGDEMLIMALLYVLS